MSLMECSSACVVTPTLLFGKVEIEKILCDIEGSVFCTTRNNFSQFLFAYMTDETTDSIWLVIVAREPSATDDIKIGCLMALDAMANSQQWLACQASVGGIGKPLCAPQGCLPSEYLPVYGVPLCLVRCFFNFRFVFVKNITAGVASVDEVVHAG